MIVVMIVADEKCPVLDMSAIAFSITLFNLEFKNKELPGMRADRLFIRHF